MHIPVLSSLFKKKIKPPQRGISSLSFLGILCEETQDISRGVALLLRGLAEGAAQVIWLDLSSDGVSKGTLFQSGIPDNIKGFYCCTVSSEAEWNGVLDILLGPSGFERILIGPLDELPSEEARTLALRLCEDRHKGPDGPDVVVYHAIRDPKGYCRKKFETVFRFDADKLFVLNLLPGSENKRLVDIPLEPVPRRLLFGRVPGGLLDDGYCDEVLDRIF